MNEFAVRATDVRVSFGKHDVLCGASCQIQKGSIVTFVGRNGCGKSTLLKVITGNIKSKTGQIEIDGKNFRDFTKEELARKVAFLPQVHEIPKDMTAEELVFCGRYPYQHWWTGVSMNDREVVHNVMKRTNTLHLKEQLVASLSGGERQRVWIAMALAQEPKILFLDEPTTYLDICHQLEVLELVSELNREEGLTVAMVLHDINQALRYSSEIFVIENGKIDRHGSPLEVFTSQGIAEIFEVDSTIEINNEMPHIRINGLLKEHG